MKSIEEIQKTVCSELRVGLRELRKQTGQDSVTISARAISIVICHQNGFKKAEIMKNHGCSRQNFDYAVKVFNRVNQEEYYKKAIERITA